MKFYNPFKPHVCQFTNGKFAIRKLSIPLGWVYLDQQCDYDEWLYTDRFVQEFAVKDTEESLKLPFGMQVKQTKTV